LQRNSEQADQWQRRTYELTEQGQVTDRYTKAIEQLGSEKADVRIGGIYALERIARDSEKDHPAVMEVLTAFIREQRPSLDHAASGEQERSTWPDVQAAVTVVGRRDAKRDIRRIDLTRADLTGMTFRGAALNGAILNGATLRGADLGAAHLNGATFRGADLTDALLWTAHLNSANLADANLTGAIVVGTDLTDAVLTGADLTGTVPWRARFTPAHSRRVTLTDDGPRTLLLMLPAKLTGAWWPADTPVPGGWKLARGRLVGARTDSGPTEAS